MKQAAESLASRILQIAYLRYSNRYSTHAPRATSVTTLYEALVSLRKQLGEDALPTSDTPFADYMLLITTRTMRRAIDVNKTPEQNAWAALQDLQLALRRYDIPLFDEDAQRRLAGEFTVAYQAQARTTRTGVLSTTIGQFCRHHIVAHVQNTYARRKVHNSLSPKLRECAQARSNAAQRKHACMTFELLCTCLSEQLEPGVAKHAIYVAHQEWSWLAPHLLVWPGDWHQLIQMEQGQLGSR